MPPTRRQFLAAGSVAALGATGYALFPGSSVTAAPSPFNVRGVSFANSHRTGGYGSDDCRRQLEKLASIGVNWIAITEFANMEAVDKPTLRFWGGPGASSRPAGADGRFAGLTRTIHDARARGIQTLVKPHLWSRDFWGNNKWHGDIAMTSAADWDTFFDQYTQYILSQAQLAADAKAEAFCVGLEYLGMSTQEARWRKLIAAVRKVFAGHLTYAAHFSEYRQIRFWDALDCVGINAYWPVTQNLLASENEIRAGWQKIYRELEPFAQEVGKPICFTELGYTASSTAGKEPWSTRLADRDEAYQARLYRVALEEVKKRDYVHGVFLWKWFTSDQADRREGGDPFALQNRDAAIDEMRRAFR